MRDNKEIWKYDDADQDHPNIAIGDFPFNKVLPDDVDEADEI